MKTIESQDRGTFTSASSAQADDLCHGRHLMQRGLTEAQDESAQHGTAIHDALAKQDPSGLDVDQRDIYDSCLAIEKGIVAAVFGAEVAQLEATPIREKRFWIKWQDNGQNQHSAQIDAAYRKGPKALIIEYKTLTGDVAGSPQNMQLRDQVVLFDHNNPMLAEVYVAVIQPLVTHKPQLAVYKREDVIKSRDALYKRVLASNDPSSQRTPGTVQCKFCKAASAGKCPEYNKWASEMVTTVATLMHKPLSETPCAEWTPEQRALFCQRLPIAQKWLDDCKASMKEALKADPGAVPGFTLKDGAKRETITNPQSVFDTFSHRGGTLEQFMDCIKVSKTDLKEKVAVVTKAKGKKLDTELSAIIGDNFTVSQNEASLVPVKESA